jgi:hypothetical protein
MYEDVLTRLALNKAIPLRSIEPLHHTLFSGQLCTPPRRFPAVVQGPLLITRPGQGGPVLHRRTRPNLRGILAQSEMRVQSLSLWNQGRITMVWRSMDQRNYAISGIPIQYKYGWCLALPPVACTANYSFVNLLVRTHLPLLCCCCPATGGKVTIHRIHC